MNADEYEHAPIDSLYPFQRKQSYCLSQEQGSARSSEKKRSAYEISQAQVFVPQQNGHCRHPACTPVAHLSVHPGFSEPVAVFSGYWAGIPLFRGEHGFSDSR